MRSFSIGASIASAALMSMASAGAAVGATIRELRDEEPVQFSGRRRRRYRNPGQTKKSKAGLYKGSRWAKKATRLGGNPARF